MLSPDVQALITRSIHSSAALELLLLLHRSPDTYWTAAAAGSALGGAEERIEAALQLLEKQGLLARARETVAFRFAPEKESDRRTVDALAEAYETRRLAVLDAVHSSGMAAAQAFADAFRFRR